MVKLDASLLSDARSLINSDNGPQVEDMISGYEQAVHLHNRQHPGHEIYRMRTEMRLRRYVRSRHDEAMRQRTRSVIDDATQLSVGCRVLADTYDRMERDLAEWIRTGSRRRS
jgi:hypothetical protein